MSEEIKQEIRNAINTNRMYDWVVTNYHRLDKFELATLLKEYIFICDNSNDLEVLENLEENEWI